MNKIKKKHKQTKPLIKTNNKTTQHNKKQPKQDKHNTITKQRQQTQS